MNKTLDYILKRWDVSLWKQDMPVEITEMDRGKLASMFGELGFTKGAEIGVEEGKYSESLCKRIPNLELICVDPWLAYKSYREHLDQPYIDKLYANCRKRLAPYNCKIIRATSVDGAKEVEDESLDFVYIDGNHRFEFLVADLAAWTPKVRKEGIISGHDWIRMSHDVDMRNNPVHVMHVLPGWTKAYRIKPWFVCGSNRKEIRRDMARSWFWVKE